MKSLGRESTRKKGDSVLVALLGEPAQLKKHEDCFVMMIFDKDRR